MSWQVITPQNGPPYEVNWIGVINMIRAYVRSELLYRYSKTVEEPQIVKDPIWKVMILPPIRRVEVNWPEVRKRTEVWSETLVIDFWRLTSVGMAPALE